MPSQFKMLYGDISNAICVFNVFLQIWMQRFLDNTFLPSADDLVDGSSAFFFHLQDSWERPGMLWISAEKSVHCMKLELIYDLNQGHYRWSVW